MKRRIRCRRHKRWHSQHEDFHCVIGKCPSRQRRCPNTWKDKKRG